MLSMFRDSLQESLSFHEHTHPPKKRKKIKLVKNTWTYYILAIGIMTKNDPRNISDGFLSNASKNMTACNLAVIYMHKYHRCNQGCLLVINVLIKLFNMITITTKDKTLGREKNAPSSGDSKS